MAICSAASTPGELATWTAAMIDRRAPRPVGGRPADRRQALDRRCRRQGLARRSCRSSPRAAPRCRSCRGAGSATPAARSTRWRRSPGGAPTCRRPRWSRSLRAVGGVIAAAGAGLAPGRPQALRAARRHRHGRVDPADRVVDHVEEDRRRHRRTGARREVRSRARSSPIPTRAVSWPRRWSGSARRTACAPSPCRPRWTPCSGGRPATGSKSPSPSRRSRAGDRPTSSRSRSRSPPRCSRWPGSTG